MTEELDWIAICHGCRWHSGRCSKDEAWKRYKEHMIDEHEGEGKGEVLAVTTMLRLENLSEDKPEKGQALGLGYRPNFRM